MGLFGRHKPYVSVASIEMMEACRDVNGLVMALSCDGEPAKRATDSLRRIGSPAVAPLINLCSCRDPGLQMKAAILLGDIKSKTAVPALVKLAYSPDIDVRASACLSLGLIGDDRAIGPLIYHLSDSSKDVRDAVALSLSFMGDRIIQPVVDCFEQSNQRLMSASDVLRTAEEIGNFDAPTIARAALSRNQMEMLQDGIAILLSYSGEPWIRDFLRCLFSSEKARDADLDVVKNNSQTLFSSLIRLVQNEAENVRLRAILSLGLLNDKKAVKPLERQLNDSSEAIRDATAAALRKMTETRLAVVDNGPDRRRMAVTFQCEYCNVPVELGSKYCPACGALLIDTGNLI